MRVQTGDIEEIKAFFVNGSHAGVTGLSPTLRIQRKTDGQFWNGSAYQAGVFDLPMTAADAANYPGLYLYAFDTSTATETEHRLRATSTSSGVINQIQIGSLYVGGFLDNIDAAVSSRATPAQILSDATPFPGANIDAAVSSRASAASATVIQEALVGRVEIDITTTPWRENHYDLATRTSIVRSFELFDQDGVALSGDDTSGNNPLFDPTRLIARRALI